MVFPQLLRTETTSPGRTVPRACLLIADAVVDDDGGEGEATEVGQGVFDAPMDVKQRVWPLAAS